MRALLNPAFAVLFVLTSLIPQPVFAAIPLPSAPSWTSHDNDYSTGGALADVNNDGWLDFLTSNGNDMALDANSVYLNSAGTLDTIASWHSSDAGYFGHCYTGDVDNDGDMDLAVAYLGSSGSGEMTVRIYRNEGGILSAAPWWKAHDEHSSFDCCLGDVDLDGDLDLAISAGDAYQNEIDSVRIYRNNAGVFDTLPFWTGHNGNCSDAVRFCDVDNDGDLDLFVGQVVPNENRGFVSMYRNDNGTLEETPAWMARPGVGWVLRLAFGDYDADGFLDLAAASNNQTGEPNSIKVFHNSGGTLDTVAAFTMLRSNRYSSCVAWGDADGDNYPELAAGGWWEPAVVFENEAGTLDTTPSWSWIPSNPSYLVCEAVAWGDLTNGHLSSVIESYSGNGQRKLFTLHRRPLQAVDSITIDGVRVPPAGYCADLLGSWVSFASAPPSGASNIVVFYWFSDAPDLAVTNWDPSHGNHLFLNTTPVGVAALPKPAPLSRIEAWPNPASGRMRLTASGAGAAANPTLVIRDVSGRIRRELVGETSSWVWDGRDAQGAPVAPGIYLAAVGKGGPSIKLVRVGEN